MPRSGFAIVLALALPLSLSAAGASAAGGELWRGPAAEKVCEVVLVNDLGGVRVAVDPAAEGAVVLGVAAELAIEAAADSGTTTLTVARRHGSPDVPGDIELRATPRCAITVRTGDGSVQVEVTPETPPLAVETVSGEITARVDPAADATVFLATSGEITTDYTIAVDYRYHEEPAKYGRVTIGGGAAEVRLNSRRGAVRVLRPSRPASGSR